jgi:hypothetical protein
MRNLVFAVMIFSMFGCNKAAERLEKNLTKGVGDSNPNVVSSHPAGTIGGAPIVGKPTNRVVTDNELNNLRLFIATAYQGSDDGKVPDAATTYNAAQQSDRKLFELLRDGWIILVQNPTPEGVWAYTKDAPITSGKVVMQEGIKPVTAAEFKRLMGTQR